MTKRAWAPALASKWINADLRRVLSMVMWSYVCLLLEWRHRWDGSWYLSAKSSCILIPF